MLCESWETKSLTEEELQKGILVEIMSTTLDEEVENINNCSKKSMYTSNDKVGSDVVEKRKYTTCYEKWCQSEETAMNIVRAIEKKKQVSFVLKSKRKFGINKASRVRWNNDGIPYIYLHSKLWYSKSNNDSLNHSPHSCTAHASSVCVAMVATFPDYQISLESGDFARRQASKKIKTNLLSKIENQSNKQFFVRFSEASPSPVKQLNWVASNAAALNLVQEFELRTYSKFVCRYTYKHNEKSRLCQIKWDKVDLTPYIVVQTYVKECHLGKDRNKAYNLKRKSQLLDHQLRKKKVLLQTSKKVGCPARLSMMECIKFPQYKAHIFDEIVMQEIASRLQQAIANNDKNLLGETRWLVKLPTKNQHRGHSVEEDVSISQPVVIPVSSVVVETHEELCDSALLPNDRSSTMHEAYPDNDEDAVLSATNSELEMKKMITKVGSLTTAIYNLSYDVQSLDGLSSVVDGLEAFHENMLKLCSHDTSLQITNNVEMHLKSKRKSSTVVCNELPGKYPKPNQDLVR